MNKSDFIIVYEGQYAGLKTESGREVLPCIYDKILDYDDDGYVRFIKDDTYGTIDLKGNVCIPLTARLTHLGVFHKGTARARIDDKWGLVDVYGNHVTEFIYHSIDAHRKYGYNAVTLDGKHGILSEKGEFKCSKRKPKSTGEYSFIATFRNGVAPAVNKYGKWVFIDENYDRINDEEYWSMDHVLRNGVYSVAKGQGAYGIADYCGVPLIDAWYDHPCDFDKGFAICDIKRRDAHGYDIIGEDGQPEYFYGILTLKGKYLFPPIYSSLHWNDADKKDCWFAEDEEWAYLLFPDGSHRVYDKSNVCYDNPLGCIPESAFDNNIKADDDVISYRPELIYTHHYKVFNENLFVFALHPWLGYVMYRLNYFYRDTDAEIDIKKLYKPGRFVRTDSEMLVTQKLLRPVHKIRFFIAAPRLYTIYDSEARELKVQAYKIPSETNFLVMDVQKYGSVTQVVLLHVPHGAMLMTKKYKVKFSRFKPTDDTGTPLKDVALHDLQIKMGENVHGHSLNDKWCEAMYQPVGCNRDLQLNRLILKSYPNDAYYRTDNLNKMKSINDCDSDWHEEDFCKVQSNSIKVYVGDITRRVSDVMINPMSVSAEMGLSTFEKRFLESVDPGLKVICEKGLSYDSGSIFITEPYGLPYRKIMHVCLKYDDISSSKTIKDIKSVIDKALTEIEKKEAKSIILPAMAFIGINEVKPIIDVLMNHLTSKKFKGNIEIFATTKNYAQIYQQYLEKIEKEK